MTSFTKENYIKTIFHLHQKNENILLSEISEKLNVSKPTASDMVKKLKADGFVESAKYKPIRITNKGKKFAAGIIRKHRLSEMFLMQIMQFGWEEVHDIAEELEHIKTDKFFDRMDELLGFPTTDPHGSTIPDKNGNFNKPNYKRLSQFDAGTSCTVRSLSDSSSDLLKYLNKKAIQLGTQLKIKHKESFDGSITVDYGKNKNVVLGKTVSDCLLVEKI